MSSSDTGHLPKPAPGWVTWFPRRGGASILATFLIAAAAGALFQWLGVPLPWMLGPLAVCAAGALAGLPMRGVPQSREVGQIFVGLAIGLRLTPEVLGSTLALVPHMALATAYVICVTTAAAFLLRPLAGVDGRTAFFATAAAGMADMAIVAKRYNGRSDAVAVVQATRVAFIVVTVPLLVFFFGRDGGIESPTTLRLAGPFELGFLVVLGTIGVHAVRPLGIPNPWLIGPVLVGALVASVGLLPVSVPRVFIVVAQIAIGISLGLRFERDLILRLPRVVGGALVVSALLVVVAAAGAWALETVADVPFSTGFLALAPAGVTEMVITAEAMHLDTALVTAFHVMRIAVIASSILVVFRAYEWVDRRINGPSV